MRAVPIHCFSISFIIFIVVIAFSAIGHFDSHIVNAQNSTAIKFLTYENPTLGIRLDYPSDWQVDEESYPDGVVRFKTVDDTMPIFVVSVHKVRQYLDTDTLTLKNTTIKQSAQQMLDVLSSLDIYYKLIRQNDIKVAGNEGLKTEYLIGNFYEYDVYTIINGKP